MTVRLAFLGLSLVLAAPADAAVKSVEQAAIDETLEAINACYSWAGELGAVSKERNAEIREGIAEDCTRAKSLTERAVGRYPRNAAILEGLFKLLQLGVSSASDGPITTYCGTLMTTFQEDPDARMSDYYRAVCPQEAKKVWGP